MAARVQQHATYDDLIRLPDNVIGELIDGDLYSNPRPDGLHAIAASGLAFEAIEIDLALIWGALPT